MRGSFKPHGERFDIPSPLSPAQVKSAVRSRMKGWFDPKPGARGWIAGPFICLWRTAHDQHGPMLIGRIAPHGLGARVHGRAGSNLINLFLYFALFPVLLTLSMPFDLNDGPGSGGLLLPALWVLLAPVMLWWCHTTRREAEPLVRFVGDAVSGGGRAARQEWAGVKIAKPMTMNVNGKAVDHTPEAIYDALSGLGSGDFIILGAHPDTFIQTAFDENGFVLEKRDGSRASHYRAVRRPAEPPATASQTFTFEEVLAAFMAYASDAPPPEVVAWEQAPTAF